MSQLTKDDIIEVLENRLSEAVRSKEFSQEWYATRWVRLKAFCEEKGFGKEVCDIFANGSLMRDNPSTRNDYWAHMNQLRHRAEVAEASLAKLTKETKRIRDLHFDKLHGDDKLRIAIHDAESALKWWKKENPVDTES